MNIKKEVSVSKVAEIVIRELNLINIDVVEHAQELMIMIKKIPIPLAGVMLGFATLTYFKVTQNLFD